MGLVETQAALARLYTDAALLDRFLAGPAGAAAELGLSQNDAEQLAAAAGEELRYFARSLLRKRMQEAAPLIPVTVKALGEEAFERLFLVWAGSHPPSGTHKPLHDAFTFACSLGGEEDLLPWIGALARYEAAGLAARHRPRPLRVERFCYPVHRFAAQVEAGTPLQGAVVLTVAGWVRLPGGRLVDFCL
jgi:hypothetical protein